MAAFYNQHMVSYDGEERCESADWCFSSNVLEAKQWLVYRIKHISAFTQEEHVMVRSLMKVFVTIRAYCMRIF